MPRTPMNDRDYSKCDVCGIDLEPDRMHVMVDNGMIIRNVYCCRKHRYVTVTFDGQDFVQTRTDREIENLHLQFRNGKLAVGWE